MLMLLLGLTLAQPPCGVLPPIAQLKLTQIGQKFEELRRGDDDQRRLFTQKAAEQLAFSVSPEWGTKRAALDRPLSKDAVARFINQRLCGWDVVNGDTREMQVTGAGEDITGQVFVSVTPANHVVEARVLPPPLGPDHQQLLDAFTQQLRGLHLEVAFLRAELQRLTDHQKEIRTQLDTLAARQILFPPYQGRLWGFPITLRPQVP